MAPQFIEVSGVVINTEQISFVDFRQEGQATVHVGGNSITTEGPEAEGLRRFFRPVAELNAPAAEPETVRGGRTKKNAASSLTDPV